MQCDPANDELREAAQTLAGDRLPEGWELVDSSSHTRVARNRNRGLYYKEFRPRSPAEKLKSALRGSRAQRAWRAGMALLDAGINAPANVAMGKLAGGREYLFTREVPGKGIDYWLGAKGPDHSAANLAQRQQLLERLGEFIGRLHATGFIHGDLRPGNILADLGEENFCFSLIDNERTRRFKDPPGKALLRNLMQLNMLPPSALSLTSRARFFRAWREQMEDLSRLECTVLGTEAYRWAMRRMREKGLLSPGDIARAGL